MKLGVSLLICPDRKSTRLNSSHLVISYAVFCLKKYITVSPARHLTNRLRQTSKVTASCVWRVCGSPLVNTASRSRRLAAAFTSVSCFFNDTATTEIYTLSLHDALPI